MLVSDGYVWPCYSLIIKLNCYLLWTLVQRSGLAKLAMSQLMITLFCCKP